MEVNFSVNYERAFSPKVSIIVPVYNVERYLEQCLDSLVSQSVQDIEIILVDDGSSDRSGKICDDYEQRYATVKTVHQKNQGCCEARNSGMKIANGKWIMFVDSDDWVETNIVECMLNEVEGKDFDLCQCQFYEEHNKKMIYRDCGLEKLKRNTKKTLIEIYLTQNLMQTGCWAKLYRRELLMKNNIIFPNVFYSEDEAFNLYVFHHTNKICYCQKPLYHYIRRGDSKTSAFREDISEKEGKRLEFISQYVQAHPHGGAAMMYYYKAVLGVAVRLIVLHIMQEKSEMKYEDKISAIKKMGKKEPFKTAIQEVRIKNLTQNHILAVILLRMKMYALLYRLCKIRRVAKSKWR